MPFPILAYIHLAYFALDTHRRLNPVLSFANSSLSNHVPVIISLQRLILFPRVVCIPDLLNDFTHQTSLQ